MNRYAPSIPRNAFGLAAVALMAVTFSLAVFLPASSGSDRQSALAATIPDQVARAPIEIVLSPSKIEVVGIRDQTTANGQPTPPKKKHQAS